MATRLFLRDTTPANDPGETERSSLLPVGDFKDYAIAVKSLSTTKGTAQLSVSGTSQGHTDHDDEFFTSFSSEALAAQTITAQTWQIAVMVAEGNGQANSQMAVAVYVFREPSTVVGFIFEGDANLGFEWAAGGAGRLQNLVSSAVTVQDGDYLVLEFWRHTDGQAMNMSYTQTLFYDGATDVIEDASPGDAASYLETPQDLVFAGGAVARRRVSVGGGGRAITI